MSLEFMEIMYGATRAAGLTTPLPERRKIAIAVLEKLGAMSPQLGEQLFPDGRSYADAAGTILRRAVDLVLEGERT